MGRWFINVIALNNIWMIQFFQNFDLRIKHLQTWGTHFFHTYYLNCIFLRITLGCRFVNFATVSRTYLFGFINFIIADGIWFFIKNLSNWVRYNFGNRTVRSEFFVLFQMTELKGIIGEWQRIWWEITLTHFVVI